jgi:hypothetical protein
MSEKKFHVGQKLILIEHSRKPSEVEVARVGRTNLYIKRYGVEEGFRMKDGIQTAKIYGYGSRVVTPEDHAYNLKRAALIRELFDLGLDKAGYSPIDYDNDTIQAVINILKEARA